jgi:UDP-glucose 4-epimerase
MRLICDHTRLTEATGWRPTMSLTDGIGATVAWFSDPANLARYRPESYTL